MKKSIQLAFTLLLMLSVSISAMLYFFYDVEQFHYKMEARQDIKVNQRLQIVKLSLKEFRDKNDPDEVWVNGELFDVSSYVIINDTAFVTVLHDEHEESLVKDIVSSFEPNDKYATDNISHVCKHRIHIPDDGKILVAPYAIKFLSTASVDHPSPRFTEHASQIPLEVIKPPPRVSYCLKG
jgi:hypothetical protein